MFSARRSNSKDAWSRGFDWEKVAPRTFRGGKSTLEGGGEGIGEDGGCAGEGEGMEVWGW